MAQISIVIPTRNRPEWVEQSLRAALAQDCKSLEVLVVDNSTPGDSATEAVVSQFNSRRLRYIRTGGLSMPENWQVAVHSSTGDYFTICSDKLILAPWLCSFLVKNLVKEGKLVGVWRIGGEEQLSMVPPHPVKPPEIISGKDIWKSAGEGSWSILHKAGPRGMNSLIHRSLVQTVESKLGVPFCRPVTPDYVIALSLAVSGVEVSFFDMIGSAFLANAHGTGMLCLTAPDEEHVRKHFDFPNLDELPLPFAIGTNLIYQDILNLNKLLSQSEQSPIHWESYFIQNIHTAVNADDLGGFAHSRKKILFQTLSDRTLREKLSLIKTISHQEITNLFKGKYPPLFQIHRGIRLLSYALPPIWKISKKSFQ
jgi:hypothetical protein